MNPTGRSNASPTRSIIRSLQEYKFLVVGHTDATGKREYNLNLSQKRADAIQEALATSFKISPQRIQAVGLGEEQLQDPAHPAAAINRRVQIVTIGKSDNPHARLHICSLVGRLPS